MENCYKTLNLKRKPRYRSVLFAFEREIRKHPLPSKEAIEIIFSYIILSNRNKEKFYNIIKRTESRFRNKQMPSYFEKYNLYIRSYEAKSHEINYITNKEYIVKNSYFWKAQRSNMAKNILGLNYLEEIIESNIAFRLFGAHIFFNFGLFIIISLLTSYLFLLFLIPIFARLFFVNYIECKKIFYRNLFDI